MELRDYKVRPCSRGSVPVCWQDWLQGCTIHSWVYINQLCGCFGDDRLLELVPPVHQHHWHSRAGVVRNHFVELPMLHLHVSVVRSDNENSVVKLASSFDCCHILTDHRVKLCYHG